MNTKTLLSCLMLCHRAIHPARDILLPSPALILTTECLDSNCFCNSATRRNLRFAAWNNAIPSGSHMPMMKYWTS